jgi:Fe2+ or Zn2+ uptake regulation protein
MISRKTSQKRILEEIIKISGSLFTANEIFNKAKNKGIGIATVYRFLKGLKYHTYICERRTVYSKEKNTHCHFTCLNCRKKTHFSPKNLDSISKSVNGKICHLQIDVAGLCNECLTKIKKK